VPWPSGVSRKRLRSVVFPAPRKPVNTTTGTRAPRSRLSLRPKRPAAGEGKTSFRNPSPGCTARPYGGRPCKRCRVRPRTRR
jgi:hypothetical protein